MTRQIEPGDPGADWVDRLVRDLPDRQAPDSLELRVLRVLEERAARPWWRRGFVHWPLAARAGFVAISTALVGFTMVGNPWSDARAQGLDHAIALAASWTHPARVVVESAADLGVVIAHAVPPVWTYGLLSIGAVLYAALVALGATAYRSIYRQTTSPGRS